MNAKELIEAAEFVADEIGESDLFEGSFESEALKLCKYTIATVREDDDEPITKEWFVEQCKNEEHDFLYVKDNMWLEYRHGTITLEGNADSHNLDQIKTRGQFRRLLESLGGGK